MAQIIKHRRGSLESISGATKRAGELLVVTGSTGITAANGDSILFVGIDGSTATPANKVLQGSSVPDLTGASYDTSIDGIPFYDSTAEKLYILNKGGNVEVKATANTGGTGIVSGSSQIIGILDELNSFTSSQESKNSTLATYTGSVDSDLSDLFSTASNHEGRVVALEAFSSSLGDGFITEAELAAATGALEDADSIIQGRLDNIEGFTSSIDVTIKTKLDADGVVSGSSQISLDSVTGTIDDVSGFTSYSSSVDSRTSALEAAVGAGSNIDGRLTSLETFSASAEANDTELFATASDHETRIGDLETFQSDIETAITVDGSNVTVNGNLTVSGTTTTIDSTTINIGDNIIELNGTGAALGGLLVGDPTAPSTASGSLLWDTTNDYWIAGISGSESKVLLADGDGVLSGSAQIASEISASFSAAHLNSKITGVVSGSVQVTISETTGYTDFSSSIATSISASVAGATWDNINGKPGGIVSGAAQVVDYLDGENVNLGGISGSSLDITGNAKIDGNIVIGGNITIGDASSDTISFGGEISSDFLPSADNTYDLGSSSAKFAEIHGTNIYGTLNGVVNSTNGVISGSSQVDADSITNFDTNVVDAINNEGVFSGSAQVVNSLLNQATDFGTGRVSGDDFGSAAGTSTFTGSFVGDGSGLTGLATNLSIEDSKGNSDTVDLLNDTLSIASGSGLGVDVTVSNNTITISGVNASTSAKGVASFDGDDFSVSSGNVSIKSEGVRAANLNSDVAGTGISLNGVDNSIEVDYGSTSGTAVEGNTSLTIQGTSNEIEISGGSITLGAGGTVTVGLPDEVTIQTGSIVGDLQVGADLTVVGNLFVQGTTTTVDSTTIQLGDNIIELNGSGAANGGLLVKDVTNPSTVSGSLLWDSTNDYWKGGALGSEKEFVRFDSTPTSGSVQVIGANGLLVDAPLTSDGTDISVTGDLVIDGLTANSFVVSDGSKTLVSVVPSNAGDLIQWNGSSFVASNTVDGGTF